QSTVQAECRDRVRRAENFHPGKIDWTISKPCATHSVLASNALSSMPGAGANASLKMFSGSIRAPARPLSENLPSNRAGLWTVRLETYPQIGLYTLYSAQI